MLSVNGRILPENGAHLSAYDRGFTWGDGLYECIRIHRGRPFRLAQHLARLRQSAATLGIGPLPSDTELEHRVNAVLAGSEIGASAIIRITVTGGIADQPELAAAAAGAPTVVIAAYSYPPPPTRYYDRGVGAITSRIRRNQTSPAVSLLCGSQIDLLLARRQAAREGTDEAILLNTDGHVCCATEANVFWVKEGRLCTPAVSCGAVPGIVREMVLEAALEADIPIFAVASTLEELTGSNEAFLTSVRIGVAPLTMIGEQLIGTGLPGPLTIRMIEMFRQYLETECG